MCKFAPRLETGRIESSASRHGFTTFPVRWLMTDCCPSPVYDLGHSHNSFSYKCLVIASD
jgi:hypothetical protein